LSAAAELGVGFVPCSPLGRGFLTGTIRSAADLTSPTDFRRRMPRFAEGALEANLSVVDVIESVAAEQGATATQLALAWLRYRADGVASVPIPGTRRASRVKENLGSLSVTLTPDQLTALDEAGARVSGDRSAFPRWASSSRE
jgi:aryl-alcohol dehydrogenase-like predicted oxidoreductase